MVNQPAQNIPPTAPPVVTASGQKQRHGCLTAWLIIIIIFNAIGLLGAIFVTLGSGFLGLDVSVPLWNSILSIILNILAIVFAIMLFQWKKFGFWGLVGIEVVNIVISAIGGSVFGVVGSVISAVIAIGILFAVLQIGKENKGWPQLE